MNKKNEEFLKQKVGWYRHLFTVFAAVTVGCAAWIVANYDKAAHYIVVLDIATIFAVGIAIGITVSKIRKYIKLLREE